MRKNSKINTAYANALLKIVLKDANSIRLVSDILDFCTLIKLNQNLRQFLSNPLYNDKKKKEFLNDFFGDFLNPLVLAFLNVLCDIKEILNISSILKVFLEILIKTANSVVIEIEIPTNENSKMDLKKLNTILSSCLLKTALFSDTNFKSFALFRQPILIYTIKQNSELLGGFTLNFLINSKVVDFSITTKIQKLFKIINC